MITDVSFLSSEGFFISKSQIGEERNCVLREPHFYYIFKRTPVDALSHVPIFSLTFHNYHVIQYLLYLLNAKRRCFLRVYPFHFLPTGCSLNKFHPSIVAMYQS